MLTEWPIKDRPCCMNRASNCRGAPKFGWGAPWLLAIPLTDAPSARLLAAADLYCTNACIEQESALWGWVVLLQGKTEHSTCCLLHIVAWQVLCLLAICFINYLSARLLTTTVSAQQKPHYHRVLQVTPKSAVANTMLTNMPHNNASAECCGLSTLQVYSAAVTH